MELFWVCTLRARPSRWWQNQAGVLLRYLSVPIGTMCTQACLATLSMTEADLFPLPVRIRLPWSDTTRLETDQGLLKEPGRTLGHSHVSHCVFLPALKTAMSHIGV